MFASIFGSIVKNIAIKVVSKKKIYNMKQELVDKN